MRGMWCLVPGPWAVHFISEVHGPAGGPRGIKCIDSRMLVLGRWGGGRLVLPGDRVPAEMDENVLEMGSGVGGTAVPLS